ncbi:hypothetical protein [Pseudomonas aeruginosa]|uniref:hypothetical protein n=1 Tax=Pseudomonas aeruginosa TaxID=287 RepID=UPI003CC60946|nr:hypothetical protein [Pseudomonas aeruginosa]
MQHYYKSQAPEVVAIVLDFYEAKAQLDKQLTELGQVFGGAVAPMRDVTSHFAGGVKLPADSALDAHWRRPDEWGFRSLRVAAKPPKGITKEQRADIRAEHERLIALWQQHCPPRLDTHIYWERLNVNTGNLMMCGGIKFVHLGTAYFYLGFGINEQEHLDNVQAGKPSAGWISGAVEILPSEYEAARLAKLGDQA